jgi:hypothetical protein
MMRLFALEAVSRSEIARRLGGSHVAVAQHVIRALGEGVASFAPVEAVAFRRATSGTALR